MKLEIFRPVRVFNIFWPFGVVHPKYTAQGLAGHSGVDFPAPDNAPIYATHNGRVTAVQDLGTEGWIVVFITEERREWNGTETYFKTMFQHLLRPAVAVGDRIVVGDVVGYAGSVAVHLALRPVFDPNEHWIFDNLEDKNGYFGAIDPAPFISKISAVEYVGFSRTLKYLAELVASLFAKQDPLIPALIQVESKGDDYAIGDTHLENKAYGPLQIRKPYITDVNEVAGTNYTAEQMRGNRKLSIWAFNIYMKRWATEQRLGKKPTNQDIARIHNGGPNGWKSPDTVSYWEKVVQVAPHLQNT